MRMKLSKKTSGNFICKMKTILHYTTVSFHNFKSQNVKLSVSNPKNKYVAYLSVRSQISNCQGLGRKNKHEHLNTYRTVIEVSISVTVNATTTTTTITITVTITITTTITITKTILHYTIQHYTIGRLRGGLARGSLEVLLLLL